MLYRDKYRIPSARWQTWDYSRPAWYFVTVCTKDKECFFGRVIAARVELSPAGRIVVEEWEKTAEVRPHIELDEYQVMPNHFHGIIHFLDVETARRAVSTPLPRRGVSTRPPKPNSLGAILGQFKGSCSRRIWAAGAETFAWQSRFFDRVIRDQDELEKIRQYIRLNPLMWDKEAGKIENLML